MIVSLDLKTQKDSLKEYVFNAVMDLLIDLIENNVMTGM